MKFLKKQPVAIAVMVLAIVLAIGIGFVKSRVFISPAPEPGLDTSLDTAYYEQFVYDQAGVLNSSAEKTLAVYLANWDARYNSIVAFVSVNSVNGDAEDYAYDLAESYDLGNGDALLLVVKNLDDYRFVYGSDFETIINAKSADRLAATLDSGEWQDCVLSFYAALNDIYVQNFGTGNGTGQSGVSYNPGHRTSVVSVVVVVAIFAVIVILLLSAIERSRYNAYRRQYYGVVNPPVVFRPIFFWHGPRSSWYRRNWHQPPPPPAPRGPGGGFGMTPPGGSFGGSRPAGGTTTRPTGSSGGFGGAGNRGPRGTGFGSGGGSFGGTRSSGSRPSSSGFGSASGSSRPSSGGSFGGTRSSGGSFGGTRSGGSFGGTRSGGSFGGGFSGGPRTSGRSGGFSGGRSGGSFGGGSRGGGGFGGRR